MRLTGEIRADRPLIVAAIEEEAAYLDDRLPVLLTGVGKVNAGIAVTAALMTTRPSAVINVGTAGAVRAGWTGIHEVSRVIQHDLDDAVLYGLTGRSFAPPIDMSGEGPVLATGDVFVSSAADRERISAVAHLVDMEGYAVAAAARHAGVLVRLVKHVSDEADDTAARSWTRSVDGAARALSDWVAGQL
jgi:adenosylhomocysteine nucleosidase